MHPLILSLLLAIPLAQSRITPKTPDAGTASGAKTTAATFAAKCTTCADNIEGKVVVNADGVDFCCTAFGHEGARVTAKCPYSFHLALADVKQQYLEMPDEGPRVWHVVNGENEHYAFSSRESAAVDGAYEWMKKQPSKILSSPLLAKHQDELAKLTHAPKIERATPCK
jgi:hypothetical protein